MPTYTPEQIKRSQDLIAGSKDLVARAQASQAPVTRYSETITPPGSTPPGVDTAPTVSRYADQYASLFKEGGAYSNMRGLTAEDENRIRDTERVRVQSQIDAINEAANQELSAARMRGQERSGRGRAIRSATGTEGSPMGDARADEIAAFNTKEQKAIEMEKQAKVDSIMNNVAYRGDEMIQKYKTEARGNADKFVAYLADIANQSRADMQALATAGAELSPDQRMRLIEQTGYDDQTFDTLYKSMKISNSEEYINKDKPQIVGNKAVFFKQTKDPRTGAVTLSTEEIELPDAGKAIKQIMARDDGMYVFYEDGTWNKVGDASTSEKKRISDAAGGDGASTTVQSQFNAARDALKSAKELADAAGRGRSWIEQQKQGLFGATEYTNLESYANTLRTNVLALATDPNVKKFFGPQMSNADVQLMTSAGTSLNPELQGPDAFKKELANLEALFTRLAKIKGVDFNSAGGGDVKARADAAGYDYDSMISTGYTEAEIDAALKAAGQ